MLFEKTLTTRDDFIILPTHDFGFKLLFGHHSDPNLSLLQSFLEALFNKKYEILEFKNREITPLQVLKKEVKLDLRCFCDGEECNLEMQMFYTVDEEEQFGFHLTKSPLDMVVRGRSYHDMKPNRQVFILAENLELAEKGVNVFMFADSKTHTVLTDKAKGYMVSLKKILDSITDLDNMNLLQKWALFMVYGHLPEHEGIKVLMKEEVFRKAVEIMKMINNDEELKSIAFAKMKREMDYRTRMETAKEEGIQIGVSQGLEIKSNEIAKNLLKESVPEGLIMKVTGISLETLLEIQNELESVVS